MWECVLLYVFSYFVRNYDISTIVIFSSSSFELRYFDIPITGIGMPGTPCSVIRQMINGHKGRIPQPSPMYLQSKCKCPIPLWPAEQPFHGSQLSLAAGVRHRMLRYSYRIQTQFSYTAPL